MKPLQNFRENTIVFSMIRKLIEIFEVLFIYWFVGSSCEMDVNLVSTAPLINGILNLKTNISKYTLQISLKYKRQLEWQQGQGREMEKKNLYIGQQG